MSSSAGDTSIVWVTEPAFLLYREDKMYRTFECVTPGMVILGGTIVINFYKGWRTDITSTPSMLCWALPQLGPHVPAALIHDRLLALQFPREMARFWAVKQLEQLENVGRFRRGAMRLGIWFWDQVHWLDDLFKKCQE